MAKKNKVRKAKTPSVLADNQGVKLETTVSIPQEVLEDIVEALPAIDLAKLLIKHMQGNKSLMDAALTAMVRALGTDTFAVHRKALAEMLDQ